jgi:hypothetical protein
MLAGSHQTVPNVPLVCCVCESSIPEDCFMAEWFRTTTSWYRFMLHPTILYHVEEHENTYQDGLIA